MVDLKRCFMDNNINDREKFELLTVCLDMRGCPNRCKHCWLGHFKNGDLNAEDLIFTAESFRPFTQKLVVYDWYREPDFTDDYREMTALRERLSDIKPEHFELFSFWRAARDGEYVKWLKSIGVDKVQITLFGNEKTTDYYVGRSGAFREIMTAIDALIANVIAPRLQIFINKSNLGELPFLGDFSETLKKRCESAELEFSVFVHQGSCDGANADLYDVRVTNEDLIKIPDDLLKATLKHFKAKTPEDVFGIPESRLTEELSHDMSTESLAENPPVFYVDGNFDVYPNFSAPAPYWRLGNLKADGAGEITRRYRENLSKAQKARLTVPISEMVKKCGNPDSGRLFTKDDYIIYLLNEYCKRKD